MGNVSRRGAGLLVAVGLAALATGAWVSYVRSIERKAVAGQKSVNVYVADATIPAGTPADLAVQKKLFASSAVPQRLVADGAVTSLDALRGRVASSTIAKGEQIVLGRFTTPQEASRLLQIPAGQQAMSVQLDGPPGVAGFVQPNDHISVIAKDKIGSSDVVRYLMQDVTVLAVGAQTTSTPVAASGARDAKRDAQSQNQAATTSDQVLLTLSVTPWQAEQLAFALLDGDVYFTLLPPGSKPAGTPGRTAESLFR